MSEIPDDIQKMTRTLFQTWLNSYDTSAERLAQDAAVAERDRVTGLVREQLDEFPEAAAALRPLLHSVQVGHQPEAQT